MINFLNSVQSASTPEPFPAPDHSIIEEELHHSDEPELKCGRWFFKASPTIYVAASTSSSQTLLKSSHEAVRFRGKIRTERPTLPFLRYQIPSPEVQLKNTWRVMLQRNVRIIPNVIPNISPNHNYNHTTQYNILQNIPLYFMQLKHFVSFLHCVRVVARSV